MPVLRNSMEVVSPDGNPPPFKTRLRFAFSLVRFSVQTAFAYVVFPRNSELFEYVKELPDRNLPQE